MDDAIGLAEALLGLDGFRVLDGGRDPRRGDRDRRDDGRLSSGVATCGVRAEAQDRLRVDIRDLPCFGRPARLVWLKRRWRCVDPDCAAKTWTEGPSTSPPGPCSPCGPAPRPPARSASSALPGRRRGPRARGVLVDGDGRGGRSTARRWSTTRSGWSKVRALGIDETSFLSATREHRPSTSPAWSTSTAAR